MADVEVLPLPDWGLLREQEEGSGFWPEMPKNGGPDWTGFDG